MTAQLESSCFVCKLRYFLDLSEGEQDALGDFEKDERSIGRNEAVYREGDAASELFIVKSGWLYSFRNTESGQRQVVQLRHPGDICGMHDLMLCSRSHTLVAIEQSVVCPLARSSLSGLVKAAPRVSQLISGLATLDHVLLSDLLQAIARTSASDRVLHLLLHLFHKLKMNNPNMERTFRLPLNQAVIGDMLGLTNVTVSKSFGELERSGLIVRPRDAITIVNLEMAIDRLGFCDRFTEVDVQWLK